MASGNGERIFLYGTLRRGASRDALTHYPGATFVATAAVRGWLYNFTAYPGLRLDPVGGWVRGEIFEATAEALAALDEWEGIPPGPLEAAEFAGEYRRVKTSVQRDDGGVETCWVYEVSEPHLAGRPVIASGDWMAREGEAPPEPTS